MAARASARVPWWHYRCEPERRCRQCAWRSSREAGSSDLIVVTLRLRRTSPTAAVAPRSRLTAPPSTARAGCRRGDHPRPDEAVVNDIEIADRWHDECRVNADGIGQRALQHG